MHIDQKTQQDLDSLRNDLPDNILAIFDAYPWEDQVRAIGSEEGYPIDDIGHLAIIVELTLYGAISSQDFKNVLKSELDFLEDEANKVTRACNARIFKPIQEKILHVEDIDTGQEHPERATTLAEIEAHTSPTKDVSGKSLIQQKLEQLFHTPPAKNEHTVTKQGGYTADPYHEPID